jgi:hypothetical protein
MMTVLTDLTLAEMLNKSVFFIDEMPLRMPGFYTPIFEYKVNNRSLLINFKVVDFEFMGFRLVPNLGGIAVTISNESYNPDSPINTPYGYSTANPFYEDISNVMYENLGFPVMLPNGDIRKSVLMISKNHTE